MSLEKSKGGTNRDFGNLFTELAIDHLKAIFLS